jgi:hypothetical protein
MPCTALIPSVSHTTAHNSVGCHSIHGHLISTFVEEASHCLWHTRSLASAHTLSCDETFLTASLFGVSMSLCS